MKASAPKSRKEFWKAKFERNIERDALNEAALLHLGWRVIVIWECETHPRNSVILSEKLLCFLGHDGQD